MCFMLTILVCLIGCQIRDPADPILETPTIIAPAPEVGHSVTTTPIVTATPPTSPGGGFLEILDEAILLDGDRIVAIDPLQGTQYEMDHIPNTRMHFNSGTGKSPVSPDGQWLAYLVVSDTETVRRQYILVFLELITGERMTYSVPPISGEMFWLPDSQHLLLTVLENNADRALWLFNTFEGTRTVVQRPFPYQVRDISPEGKYLYITDKAGFGYGEKQVDLMSGSTTNSQSVNLTSDRLRELQALWSPDGSKIAVNVADPARESTSPVCFCLDRTDYAYILELSSSERYEISLPQYTLLVEFSPDSEQIIYQDFGNCEMCASVNLPICILDVETRQSQCIEQRGFFPTWSPDGEKLAFLLYNTPESELFLGVYDLRTGVARIFYDYEITQYVVPQWVRLRPASEP